MAQPPDNMPISKDSEPKPEESVYVARQIILDHNKDIFAYELLFRSANTQAMNITDDLLATTQVLLNTLNSIGIQKMIGDKWAFINVNERVLKEKVYEALDRNKFVLEILETTEVTPELVDQMKAMKEDGYTFALDDFIFEDEMMEMFEPIFPHISVLKVDLFENDIDSLKEKLEYFKPFGIKFLAEKVETEEDFEKCQAIGFHYYQGYFFSKPEIIEGKKIQSNNLALLDLIQAVRTKTDAKEVEDVFKRYPDATVNLGSVRISQRPNLYSGSPCS
jgi:EAL and modified HD-GYP domain-containing signal transduction protein